MTVQEWLGKDNKLGIDIWHKKYQYNNESFDEWLDRVSGHDKKLCQLIKEKKFLFGGRTLANRGTEKKGSFSNCYSIGFVEDDLNDIMQASMDIAKTFKAQGGQGISLSKLRPQGCGINNGQFQSDGIIPFMEIYNRVTESISQGGSRKGALIMTLDIWHKEAKDFIKIKSEKDKIQKANLSLEIDDEFMECVKAYYKTGDIITKQIKREYNGNIVEYEVVPIKLYKLMMEKAHEWAEPGCIFTNKFRNYNLMEFDDEYNIETCNPCGEQPLPKSGACNLGSINLSEFVVYPFKENSYFDFKSFKNAISIAVEALDVVLDENMYNHPLKEQRDMAYNYRNIGLGIMGLHDCLIKLGITYGSEKSKLFINKVMRFMFKQAVITSSALSKNKGSFPKYKEIVLESEIIKNHFTDQEISKIKENGLRNCSLLSIAPSGTIGTMLNISTGCEPLFQLSYQRKTESLNGGETKYYDVYAKVVNDYINKTNNINLPDYFNTADKINWRDRVDIQSILQKHVDTAISSTINLPYDITLKEIEQLYLYSWEQGLKGVTIFRDGCKRAGILTTLDSDKDKSDKNEDELYHCSTNMNDFGRGYIISVCDDLISYKRTIKTGCGKMYLHLDFDEVTGEPFETWIDLGGSGGCERNLEFISRLISLALRAGVPLSEIIEQSKSIKPCLSYTNRTKKYGDTSQGTSCPSALGIALKELEDKIHERCFSDIDEFDDRTIESALLDNLLVHENDNDTLNMLCPECGEKLQFEGGCNICKSCGWSKCD